MRRNSANRMGVAAWSAVLALALAGCEREDPVAGLGELPEDAAVKLQLAPGFPVLATRVRPQAPAPPSPPPPAALCPQDWIFTLHDARVTMPITICTQARAARDIGLPFPTGSTITTHKLVDLEVFDLESSSLLRPPIVCKTSDGPWSASLRVERACIETCVPFNALTVLGVPNEIVFLWHGGFADHPPGFEFVGRPIQTAVENLGPCNEGPVPGPL
jgi:hypothetical protein